MENCDELEKHMVRNNNIIIYQNGLFLETKIK